ncbi:Ketosteroid isomerase-like protein [Lysobacter dokdonensis DS-58]|uniref:Ketosteroid isomerase-like protein n=1 Tax=Lysobacter dokdonensis DS-58 TaxID=1300345 RepID=A0A0A2WQM1_9GAMM|nr:nuclear transport factor 2 family protein [Lysobacter dokdonensis]KGQ20580.1 Ketosteroid isomerase-like protein [Lysobacter dokdonensis DS-58]
MSRHRKTLIASTLVVGAMALPAIAQDATAELIARSHDANAALMRGNGARWQALSPLSEDFVLMSPFGGTPSKGTYTPEQLAKIGRFFRNGSFEQELVQSWRTDDMVVLALIERATVEVGGLPAQPWALRVTLVYRRDGGTWRLAHRHADPLASGISLDAAAALGRGE